MGQIKLPAAVYFGEGSLQQLPQIVASEHCHRVAIISDKGIQAVGLLDRLLEVLNACDVQTSVYCDVAPEPSYEQVQSTVDWLKAEGTELIVAFGGGSVMDTAKLCSLLVGSDRTVKDLLNAPASVSKTVRTVMIPTTCGTGSEATCNAIVLVPEKQVKIGIVNPSSIADYVILDPETVRGLPPKAVAATGIDALAHAVECFTSKKATVMSDLYAREGARLIFHHIRNAWHNPDDIEAKSNLLLGAFYGGVSITGSGTTAVHALSYPLGGTYHIPHGVSNAVLFAPVMRFNLLYCTERLAQLCSYVYPERVDRPAEENAKFLVDEIAAIVAELKIPTLAELGINADALEGLVQGASEQTRLLVNNPVALSLDDIRGIYCSLI